MIASLSASWTYKVFNQNNHWTSHKIAIYWCPPWRHLQHLRINLAQQTRCGGRRTSCSLGSSILCSSGALWHSPEEIKALCSFRGRWWGCGTPDRLSDRIEGRLTSSGRTKKSWRWQKCCPGGRWLKRNQMISQGSTLDLWASSEKTKR